MFIYSELLNECGMDIATEGFSFKELGNKILKFLEKVLNWIKRVKNRILRFIRSLRDFKKERDSDQADIDAEAQYISNEMNRINNEVNQEFEKRRALHETKLANARKVYSSFSNNLKKLNESANRFARNMDSFQSSAEVHEDIMGSVFSDPTDNFKMRRNFKNSSQFESSFYGKFEFEPPDFPEIDSNNFENTCNAIAYYIASDGFGEHLMRLCIKDLEFAETSLNKSKKKLESWLPKVNDDDAREIQPVLMAVQKYTAKIGLATQCIERSITLAQSTEVDYKIEDNIGRIKAKSQATKTYLDAELRNANRQTNHNAAFKSRFSKEYREWYNEKYPIPNDK